MHKCLKQCMGQIFSCVYFFFSFHSKKKKALMHDWFLLQNLETMQTAVAGVVVFG